MFGWFSRRRSRQQLLADSFPPAWEEIVTRNVRLANWLPESLQKRHRQVTNVLVAERRFEGVASFAITEEVKVTVAANAAFLLLGVEGYYFDRLPSIILRPKEFTRKKRQPGWIEEDQDVLGLAAQHGPVSLAWNTVLHNGQHPERGENVVLHEFAHHLDGLDGEMGGSLTTGNQADDVRIRNLLAKEFRRHVAAVERGERTIVSPNGAENEAEFFAYSVECFYGRAIELQERHAELYQALSAYFRLDPASWRRGPPSPAKRMHRRRAPRRPPQVQISSSPPLRSADEYFARGYELWQEGHLESALADFTAALQLNPQDSELFEHRAGLLRQLERFNEAEADCRRALQLDPQDIEAQQTLGLILLDQDRFADALPLLDQAVRYLGDADSYFSRGMAKAALNDWLGAEADFVVVLQKDPGDEEAVAWLAETRGKLGKRNG